MSDGNPEIDVTPDPANSTARRTAKTSETWDSWAGSAENTLRSVAPAAKESTVTSAFEAYLGGLNPRLKSLATLAEKQGVDLGQAANTAAEADDAGKGELHKPQTNLFSQRDLVRRPLNTDP